MLATYLRSGGLLLGAVLAEVADVRARVRAVLDANGAEAERFGRDLRHIEENALRLLFDAKRWLPASEI